MPERGQAGAPRLRPGIQQYGNVRGKKRTPLEKLADQKEAEKRQGQFHQRRSDRGIYPNDPVYKREKAESMAKKSESARKAAATRAAKKKAQTETTAVIPPERTVKPEQVTNPFPKGEGKRYNPQRSARTNVRATGKGLAKVAGAAAAVTAGSAILGGSTDRTGSKESKAFSGPGSSGGRFGPKAARSKGQAADIGHDRPGRPLPSTASTGPAKYQPAANRVQAASRTSGSPVGSHKRTVTVPSTGMYSTEYQKGRQGGVTDEQVRFAKKQLSAAGYAGKGTGRQVVNSFKALNQGVAKRRTEAGAGRAKGYYSALAAGVPPESKANATARRSRVPRMMGR